MKSGLLAYGDPHGEWGPLLRECARRKPEAVLIVGDCDLFRRTLREELAPLWRQRVPIRYVHGNHDVDTSAAWENLVIDFPEGNLSGRIETLAGVTVAGLGGTFEAPLWSPNKGMPPAFQTREAYFESIVDHPYRESLTLKHLASIVPDDFDRLLSFGSADVLLCHEAPETHPFGVGDIGTLAEVLGAKLVVHGHHHESGEATLPGGIRVRALARAEPWWVELP